MIEREEYEQMKELFARETARLKKHGLDVEVKKRKDKKKEFVCFWITRKGEKITPCFTLHDLENIGIVLDALRGRK